MDVVCGIIDVDDRYLIARRGKGIHEHIWEFPGGKVEAGETNEAAVVRELKEELNIDVCVLGYVTSVVDMREDMMLQVHAYRCRITGGALRLQVHHEIAYVKAAQLYAYNFEKADIAIIDTLNSCL